MSINPPLRLLAACQEHLGGMPEHVLMVPGRDLWVAAQLRPTSRYTLIVPDLRARTSFTVRSAARGETFVRRPLPGWSRYPVALLRWLDLNEAPLPGVAAVIAGEEPPGPRFEHSLGLALDALRFVLLGHEPQLDDLMRDMDEAAREFLPPL